MSKYRLCYKKLGRIIPVELEKLECLQGKETTDIKIIDAYTMQFIDIDSLLTHLRNNNLIDKYVDKLFVTVDKKDKLTWEKTDKKIYNGEILLFSTYRDSYNASAVSNHLLNNKNNYEFIINVCNNYLEKYQNAKDRITGASFILTTLCTIKTLAEKMKLNNYEMNLVESQAYNQCLNDFVTLEFFKIDKDVLKREGKIRKKVKDGRIQVSYRNIHDYITLIISLSKVKKIKQDEVVEQKEIEHEEFLTEEDIKRSNNKITSTYKAKGFPEIDGIDYHIPLTEEDLVETLYESGMKLCLKPGDAGYLK